MTDDTRRPYSLGIRVFGASEVTLNGQPVSFLPKKARWVVMLLALASARNRSLSRGELSLALWPFGDGSDYPVNRLMADLRSCLGPAAERILEPAAHVLRLDLAGADFDLDDFRSALLKAVERADPAPIEAAAHLLPSQLLTDYPVGLASVEPERERLRQELFAALDAIADRARERDDLDAETRALSLAVEENPRSDEDRTRSLVQAFERLGSPDKAVRALERFREKGGSRTANLPPVSRFKIVAPGLVNEVSEPKANYRIDQQSSGEQLRVELTRVINKEQSAGALRRVLRQHPQLLVGSDFVHAGIVLSDVQVGKGARADFAYIEPQSGRSYIHMISFADPSARIFSEREEFTPHFHRASELLEACIYWIGRNQLQLPSVFGPRYEEIAHEPLAPGFFIPRCKLIIGRRSELNSTRGKEKLEARRGPEAGGLTIRTYNGFLEEAEPTIRTDPLNERTISCCDYDNG